MSVILKKSVKMGSYVAHLKIQKVPPNSNRPDGFKVNFVLVSLKLQQPVLLVDNHKPFGYHIHPELHLNKTKRVQMNVSSPFEAMDIFVKKAEEISNEE